MFLSLSPHKDIQSRDSVIWANRRISSLFADLLASIDWTILKLHCSQKHLLCTEVYIHSDICSETFLEPGHDASCNLMWPEYAAGLQQALESNTRRTHEGDTSPIFNLVPRAFSRISLQAPGPSCSKAD